MSLNWLDIAKQIQSISQAGLTFTENKYDQERYEILRDLSVQIIHEQTGLVKEKVKEVFASEKGYQTPKVDIRGVVFRKGKILMVQESIDNHWSIPGGWADVGFTPFEVAGKEVFEEAGLEVNPIRLSAVLDKRSHKHPPDLFHVYKMFILCKDTGGPLKCGMETLDAGFFGLDELPPLSVNRNTKEQIELMFEFHRNPDKKMVCD